MKVPKRDIYRRIKTVKDLHAFLDMLVRGGLGNAIVEFDTEARKFNYHMALISGVSYMPKHLAVGGIPSVFFHEASKKDAEEIAAHFGIGA